MKQRVFSKLDGMKDEAIALLRTLLSFDSVDTPTSDPDAPHGEAVAGCLAAALKAAKDYGLSTTNLDGEAGLIDSDEGISPKIGMLCHLDVVPAGEGWSHDPFKGEIEDGKLFGRGTSDDKGPFVCALLALAAIRACDVPLKYPIRLIAGTCEETGSADIAYCKERGVIPPYVFSPDANYPVVNTEKGMARFSVSATLPEDSTLSSLFGGEVLNMVPQSAAATLKDGTILIAEGKSAHASTPELGENAVSALFSILCAQLQSDPAYGILETARGLHPPHVTDGSPLGIEASDEISGSLTCSLGLARLEDGILTLSFDVRHPLCTSADEIREKLEARLCSTPFSVTKFQGIAPHHVDENSPFVQSLLSAYTEVTGLEGYCIAIGGGTYVHDIDGGVAFGTCFPNQDCRIHSPDEFTPVEDLILNAKIFAAALLKLQEQTL
ncbi:MAG: M20/M25/M40 family metallo-hydrolase [Clostridia bacterium]|nr:M20/M25/M40 family metallo-hydrolase [Clostridia bacterium]